MNQKEINDGLKVVGEKVKEAIDNIAEEANRLKIKAQESEDAWGDHDWTWLLANNVISRDLYDYIDTLGREQCILDKSHQ